MAQVIDIYLIYQFLKRLTTPFEKWDAYKSGVIDKDGVVIVNKENRSSEQARTWGYYDILLANLKKLLGKLPGGKTRIASFAAALLLLKENEIDPENVEYLEERLLYYMDDARILAEEFDYNITLDENVPTNAVGTGNIAGAGVGPQGEPGVNVKNKRNTVLANILRRKKNAEFSN